MKTDRLFSILLVILISCGVFPARPSSAGMDGMHGGTGSVSPMKETDVVARLTTEPQQVTTGKPATVRISLETADGKPLQGLTIMHDRYLHVVIVSRDFSVFAHLHPRDFEHLTPEVLKGGIFFVRFTFPKAGRYVVGIDFAVKGKPFSRHFMVDVSGSPEMTSPKADFSREEKADSLDVSFEAMPAKIRAKKKAVLSYVFRRDGKPVTDLEPWLAAPMHLAIVSSDLSYFMHVHGELPGMSSPGSHEDHMHIVPSKFGPRIKVPVVFPSRGLYAVFGQTGYKGKVILTRFMVEIE